jgi:hypothetical protein
VPKKKELKLNLPALGGLFGKAAEHSPVRVRLQLLFGYA